MALKSFLKGRSTAGSNSSTDTPPENNLEKHSMGKDSAPGSNDAKTDVEAGTTVRQQRRTHKHPMNRLDKPRAGSIASLEPTGIDVSVEKQMAAEEGNAIRYRTCSWQKTAALLFSEYICLAIMSFPWSYGLLGLVPGLILTLLIAGIVLYTSLVLWEFCLRHPEVKDVCDLGQMLFFNWRAAWWFTGVMFLLNNTFIMGFHCLVGAEYLNTVSRHGMCTIGFSAIFAVIQWICSMPRTFSMLAKLATVSALFTFISVILATVFAGIEDHPVGPNGYDGTPIDVWAIPPPSTNFVTGMSAFLNISYTFIGQITLPSFIAEMKEPKDFPKALWAVTIAEVLVFSICGAVTYAYMGSNYVQAPAFASIGNRTFQYVSFSFMLPTLIFLGVLYASVSARFVFFNIFAGTRHMGSHTVVGWLSWAGILAVLWVFAFIIAEVIPFFSDLLSLMSSLFDSFFGFIFWGVAYARMRRADYGPRWYANRGLRGWIGAAINMTLIAIGLFFLGGGTYVSVQSIVNGYAAGNFGGAFTCKSNGFSV